MSPESALSISYFSDILCVWAYFAQIKLDQIRRDFGSQVKLLELAGEICPQSLPEHAGNTRVEELIWRLRTAFFRDARDVCSTALQAEIAGELELPVGRLRSEMENGRAFAALFADAELQKQHLIQGSPTFLLNEGRQKLYGNVGYRIIRANLEELLEGSEELVLRGTALTRP